MRWEEMLDGALITAGSPVHSVLASESSAFTGKPRTVDGTIGWETLIHRCLSKERDERESGSLVHYCVQGCLPNIPGFPILESE